MPTSVEAVLILVVVVSPGFIAVAVKNGFVPYRQPSQFQETVESILLSTLLLPVWASFARPLLRARDAVLATWTHQTPVPVWTIAQAFGLVVLIYLVGAPVLGILYGLLRRWQPQSVIANATISTGRSAWRKLGRGSGNDLPFRLGSGPEVWDDVIDTDLSNTPWARVWFKDGTGLEGVVGRISMSPAPHQIYLTTLQGARATLLRLGSDGAVTADLGGQGALGVWVDLTSDVRCVEFLQ